jgi:hypothetical protein
MLPITLFLDSTTIGNSIAVIEHICKGKYSKGLPHVTKLKMIAEIPASDNINSVIYLAFSPILFNKKKIPTHATSAIIKLEMWTIPNVPQTINDIPFIFL